jgi:hypothetical protein
LDAYSPGVRGIALIAIALLAVVAAGCGGSGEKAATTPTAASPAAQRAEIKRVWERFFAGSTSASEKEKLLENGSQFSDALDAAAKSPFAKQSGARVNRVTLLGPAKAKVVYAILLSGKPVLSKRQGTAVNEDGHWKVGTASFCQLLALQGGAPKQCTSVS